MKKRSQRKAAAAGRRPPLDSPNWISIKNAFSRVYQCTGNLQLAAKDLRELLAARRNRVRSMRRSLVQGQEPERELLSTKFWHENVPYALSDDLSHSLFVVPVEKFGSLFKPHQYPVSHVYYVWQPDLDKLYPTAMSPTARSSDPGYDKPPPQKPGKRPKGEWQLVVWGELLRRARDAKPEPTAAEMCDHLETEITWQPDIRSMQKALRDLRPLLKAALAVLS
jgi:hypothetical protein